MNRHSFVVMTFLLSLMAAWSSGCGTGMITAKQDMKAGPDAAVIVFLRPNPLAFGGAEFTLWDRDKFIGLIEPVTSVSYRAKPGDHTFMVKAGNWDVVKGKVAAGKTYYFWIDPGIGAAGTRVSMFVLDPNDKRVKEWLKKCRPTTVRGSAQALAYEKKYGQQVAAALGNLESGKARFAKLNPAQGK